MRPTTRSHWHWHILITISETHQIASSSLCGCSFSPSTPSNPSSSTTSSTSPQSWHIAIVAAHRLSMVRAGQGLGVSLYQLIHQSRVRGAPPYGVCYAWSLINTRAFYYHHLFLPGSNYYALYWHGISGGDKDKPCGGNSMSDWDS